MIIRSYPKEKLEPLVLRKAQASCPGSFYSQFLKI